MEFLRSFLRCHLAGKPVVASPNLGCFLRLKDCIPSCPFTPFHSALATVSKSKSGMAVRDHLFLLKGGLVGACDWAGLGCCGLTDLYVKDNCTLKVLFAFFLFLPGVWKGTESCKSPVTATVGRRQSSHHDQNRSSDWTHWGMRGAYSNGCCFKWWCHRQSSTECQTGSTDDQQGAQKASDRKTQN